jgi:hypothetical protein
MEMKDLSKRKQLKLNKNSQKEFAGSASKFILALMCISHFGCSSWWTVEPPKPNPNVYHVGEHGWSGDSIYFKVYRTADPSAKPGLKVIEVDCKSCNLINAPFKAEFDESGMTRVYIPETRQLVSARLHIRGDGIDTTFIQMQRPPKQAMDYYKLSGQLTGRVMIDQMAILYFDSTLDSAATSVEIGDELNTYASKSTSIYLVHHPNFSEPLYLFKEDAVRLY